MPGLPDDGVDDVKPRDLELWSALLYELLDGLDDVLVELDCLNRRLGDRGHARLRDRRLQLVQRRQLLVERLHRLHLERLTISHLRFQIQMSRLNKIPGRSRFFAIIFPESSSNFLLMPIQENFRRYRG